MSGVIDQAVDAMLEYEAWLATRVGKRGGSPADHTYTGVTADAILTAAAGGDLTAWCRMAVAAIKLATTRRGCSATTARVRGQKERRRANGQGKRDDGGRRDRVRAALAQGWKAPEIAHRFGVTRSYVHKLARTMEAA
jgi:hypothetical protein